MKKRAFTLTSIIIPAIVVFFNFLLIMFPKETISASKEGVMLWFQNVLPSLLPFAIGANLLSMLGAVNFLGVLLEPLMRPLFNVPGCGGFAMAIGLTSGYPMGAKVTAELYRDNEITKTEAQRLISFVNNSGPLFVLGAVAAGMFENIAAGYFILIVHYIAAIVTGLLFRYYKSDKSHYPRPLNSPATGGLLRKAAKAMRDKRLKNSSLGTIFGQSVINSMETMLHIGGFIILFCVIVEALDLIGIIDALCRLIPFMDNKQLLKGILSGIIEMTNGCKNISVNGVTKDTVLGALAIISWGGFSIHAQAATFLSNANINIPLYLLSKAIHSIISIILGFAAYPFFKNAIEAAQSVETSASAYTYSLYGGVLSRLLHSMLFFGAAVALLLLAIIIGNGILFVVSGKHGHGFKINLNLVKKKKRW